MQKSAIDNVDTIILLFSKAPIPGEVKTRLIPRVDAEDAAKIHRLLLEKVLESVSEVDGAVVQLWVANDAQHPFIQQLQCRYNIDVYLQQGRDLGERMKFAVEQVYSQCRQVILIGGDCVSVLPGYIQRSIDLMKRDDVDLVLGPAEDGGYVMMGIPSGHKSSVVDGLFSDVDWGEPMVLSQTVRNANKLNLHMSLLESRWDVDRWEDVERAIELELLPELEQIIYND